MHSARSIQVAPITDLAKQDDFTHDDEEKDGTADSPLKSVRLYLIITQISGMFPLRCDKEAVNFTISRLGLGMLFGNAIAFVAATAYLQG